MSEDIRAGDAKAFKFVVKVGFANDYAIYCGPSHWTDARVESGGSKLPSEAGTMLAKHIPELAHHWYNLSYRR